MSDMSITPALLSHIGKCSFMRNFDADLLIFTNFKSKSLFRFF